MTYKDPDYMKKWRARNKDKISAYNKGYHTERSADPDYRAKATARAKARYLADVPRAKSERKRWYAKNKGTQLARAKAKYDPVAHRHEMLMRKYGITPAIYAERLAAQQHSCAICKTTTPGGGMQVFPVDHDHATNRVRGLLCNRCNRALGLFKDDAAILHAAAAYLQTACSLSGSS